MTIAGAVVFLYTKRGGKHNGKNNDERSGAGIPDGNQPP